MSANTTTNADVLQQFNVVREALKQERQVIEARLDEINKALGENDRGRGMRPRNEMSLKEAIIQVVAKRPLSRHEVLEEVEKIGYKFASTNPLNSIGVVLYGKNPKFKRVDGKKFALAK